MRTLQATHRVSATRFARRIATRTRCVPRLIASAIGLLACSTVPGISANATILPFIGPQSGGQELPHNPGTISGLSLNDVAPTYGDNVSSLFDGTYTYLMGNAFTPNITLSFTEPTTTPPAPGSGKYNWDPYSDDGVLNSNWFEGVAQLNSPSSFTSGERIFDVTLTPDSGFGVLVNSFDIVDYRNHAAGHTVDWEVWGNAVGDTLLASGTQIVPADAIVPVSTGLGSLYPGIVVLRLDHQAGSQVGVAVDNINFDQVPEPSTALLLTTGLAGLAVRKRVHR